MKARHFLIPLFLMMLVAVVSGCDWIQYAFMNSIPFKGDPKKNPDVYVYMGVDGLSYHTVQDAMKRGAFTDSSWRLARNLTPFPGTSDANWTKIMHTEKLGGYEIEYYDPTTDTIANKGLLGLGKHIMPAFSESISFEAKYLSAFDYRANGYTHALEAYSDTFESLGETFDNFMFTLEGRSETATVFSAYMLEFDVLGHMRERINVTDALIALSKRIDKFVKAHPERRFHFTIISDHGMDFIPVPKDRLIVMENELPKVGIKPVSSILDHDPKSELFAIPIMHTRVTYIALHTHPDLIEEVAGRVTQLESVDLSISKLKIPAKDPHAKNPLQWYGIWADGKLGVYFGFDPQTNEYYLPAGQNYARFDLAALSIPEGADFKVAKDGELFKLCKDTKYPDLFYRTRTALSPVGVKYPADVLVSFKDSYVSMGFQLPGKDDIATASFHGAMSDLGTTGTVLTNERDLPDAVRAETIMDLFPRLKEHMKASGVEYVDGDPNASLEY